MDESNTISSAFTVVLIKPSRYDDDGYPIIWHRVLIPSNSLAVMNGITLDCSRRKILGENVSIHIELIDETSRRVQVKSLIAGIKRRGGRALVCMVGVQTNQYPRAIDIARLFRAAGLPVAVGGFHVSGCIAMLPEIPPEIQSAIDEGITIFAGEAEGGRFEALLLDAWHNRMQPVYNHLSSLPNLAGEATPLLPASVLRSNAFQISSFDLGRGCPFQCSFCTIINVQGKKSRFRTADDIERIIRENQSQGISMFFITDDNFVRNAQWEACLDRLIALREQENIDLTLIIQVDTLCHKVPRFIEKAARAGVQRVFIGLENINPANLIAAEKRQNKITDYRQMMQEWRNHGVYIWAGYILGFPNDTKCSIAQDIEIIKKELPLDVLEIFMLTPLPGSEDHRNMLQRGEWMDSDLNKYNLHSRVSRHPTMSDGDWEDAYDAAWRSYYSWDHIETVARRSAALADRDPSKVITFMVEFKAIYEIEKVHVLEGGLVRKKFRSDRRPGLPRVPPGIFHLKLAMESFRKAFKYAVLMRQASRLTRKIREDAQRYTYSDAAVALSTEDSDGNLAIFTQTKGGPEAVERQRSYRKIAAQISSINQGTI